MIRVDINKIGLYVPHYLLVEKNITISFGEGVVPAHLFWNVESWMGESFGKSKSFL